MTSRFPKGSKWTQNNRSDVKGDIVSSFNIDTQSNEGKLRVSPRAIITTDDITDLGVAVGFKTFTSDAQYVFAPAGSYIFRVALADGYQTAFSKEPSQNLGTSSDVSDIVNYGKTFLLVSYNTTIYFMDTSNNWATVKYDANGTPTAITLTGGVLHMLCNYAARIYVTEANTKIWSIDATTSFSTNTDTNDVWVESGSYSLNLANKGWDVTLISTIRECSDGIWVFTINQAENGCWVFKWDGAKANDPNEAFLIPDASGILAAVIRSDVPWVIDNNAQLRVFNGKTFVKTEEMGLASGKLPVKNAKFLKNPLSAVNDRWIHPNGIDIVDGRIRILVNNEYEDNGATIEENLASGVWEYDPQTGWSHIMSLSLYTSSVTDYGQNRVSRVGALYAAKTETTNASANGTMLLGAQLFSDASSTKEVIAMDDSNDTVQKFGYVVTTKVYSSQVRDTWKKLFVRLKKLLDSADRVWVRYRTSEVTPTEATITWTSTTTFTTTTNVEAYEGFEVEVLQGKGAGRCERITDVSESGGTYTVTVASAFTGASSGTAKARFQYWKEAGVVFNSQTDDVAEFPLEDSSPWVQFKLCMQFTGKNEVDDLLLARATHQKIEV